MFVLKNGHAQKWSGANCHAILSHSKQFLKKYSSFDVSTRPAHVAQWLKHLNAMYSTACSMAGVRASYAHDKQGVNPELEKEGSMVSSINCDCCLD